MLFRTVFLTNDVIIGVFEGYNPLSVDPPLVW